MTSIPISEFEHRVARWISHVEKTGEPLEISQRGRAKLVILHKNTFEQWKAERERHQALEIRLLVEAGDRAFREGRFQTHEEVGRRLGLLPGRKKRRR